ncbi:unnamed protein product [Medioppia subpectinata]|uniref:UDP-glycosyltransferase n=1 Tax=Medioppia subpectinata TaxID=1979941 RepID=A0A7R9KFN9_9ACAR|nr:unnamed protein product [Medioppia subpectinata]CAG2102502.1 unnamed protein product [Medioppia subpectinata]
MAEEDRPKADNNPNKHVAKQVLFSDLSPIERMQKLSKLMVLRIAGHIALDREVETIVKQISPDLIVLDQHYPLPYVEACSIPFVWVRSGNPLLLLDDERTPPAMSGLPITGDKSEWKRFRELRVNAEDREAWSRLNDWVISRGCAPLNRDIMFNPNISQCLSVYGFPLELDYLDVRPLPPNCIRFDNLMRNEKHSTFVLPDVLTQKSNEKLIYFSLGSIGAANVDNMKRLVSILGKSRHRFIVSKGPLHDTYTVPDNMWGAGTVPQIQVLPLVDLVITHGGNNTVSESIDQLDNGQQIQHKGFGVSLNAFRCTEEELLGAVDRLLTDKALNQKLAQIGERIRTENTMAQSLTILFIPIGAVGHVNACIGIAEPLIGKGHRVVFAVESKFETLLKSFGIEVIGLADDVMSGEDRPEADGNLAKHIADRLMSSGMFSDLSPIEKMQKMGATMGQRIDKHIAMDRNVEPIVKQISPHLIVLDQHFPIPYVEACGIPYVWVRSGGPLLLMDDERTPPALSGLPITGDKNEWKRYREQRLNAQNREAWSQLNDYAMSRGCAPLNRDIMFNPNISQCLSVYGFPLELDYLDVRPLPPNCIRFDNLMRNEKHLTYKLPDVLKQRSDEKLIYFSLGSMGAANVDNMKRLVAILGKSRHRFIVSKGPLHDTYTLPDNMWGAGTVPQLQVLPLVDLVITHGGNNTLTESMYFGKPMIVLPFFGDQLDNGQQIQHKGLGITLNAFHCTEEELLGAVDRLLTDKTLYQKLAQIGERIRTENKHNEMLLLNSIHLIDSVYVELQSIAGLDMIMKYNCFKKPRLHQLWLRERYCTKTMAKRLTVLFVPINAAGHLNACISIAELLIGAGHRAVFAIETMFKTFVEPFAIEVISLTDNFTTGPPEADSDPNKHVAKQVMSSGMFSDLPPIEKMQNLSKLMASRIAGHIAVDREVETIVKQINPDLIVLDQHFPLPYVEACGIPYVWVRSGNPLFLLDDERTPPAISGLPFTSDKSEWKRFRELRVNAEDREAWSLLNDWVISRGCAPLNRDIMFNPNLSKCLCVYGYPLELDYLDVRLLPPNCILITHGGNNTVTESMYFGKPMIVLPFFGDQLDNGQQIQHKGFGITLNAFRCTEEELLGAVDRLLTDKALNQKLSQIGERIRTENNL